MTQAAHSTVIKTTGTSTAVVAGACTDGGAHTAYQLTDATKRAMDPTVVPVVYEDGVATAAAYTIDGLTGTVTFAAARGGAVVVTMDYSYLPLLAVAAGKEFSVESTAALADKTTFDDSGIRKRMATLFDAKGTIGLLAILSEDLDASGNERKLADVLQNGTMVYLEIQPGGSGQKFRAYVHLDTTTTKGSGVEGLIDSTLSFVTTLIPDTFTKSFSWAT